MKILFASSCVLVWMGVASSATAWAASAAEGLACLQVGDLRCAQEVRDALKGTTTEDALRVAMRTAFREGRYAEAVERLDELEAKGIDVAASDSNPYRATLAAAQGLLSAEAPGVVLRHSAGVDRILVDDGLEVLEASRRTYDHLFGGGPDHEILLDIYPTARRFIAASGLPPDAVRATGVIALSKWSRLLVSSPRALSRGYGWKDTVAHEYIHLVVSWRTADRAPVWLQEGLAKHLESRWRGGRGHGLSVHQQTLLAEALRSDSFVPFEKFRHSMAYLDSGDEAALAFAQVSTLVEHLLERGGDAALVTIMNRLQGGEAVDQVVAEAAGYGSFSDFMAGWRTWLATRPLIEDRIASLPVVLDGAGDEYASDPLLAQRGDLARLVRVGDLLREKERPLAALIEYRKAMDPDETQSPLLMAREAECLLLLGRHREALGEIEEAVSLYPEFTLLQVIRGRTLDDLGRPAEAAEAWRAAHDLNPFDPEVQNALSMDLGVTGDAAAAARHARYAAVLQTGGATGVGDASTDARLHSLGMFSVPLRGPDGKATLQVAVQALGNDAAIVAIDEAKAELKTAVADLGRDFTIAELSELDGKVRLRKAIMAQIQQRIAPHRVDGIIFTQFGVQ